MLIPRPLPPPGCLCPSGSFLLPFLNCKLQVQTANSGASPWITQGPICPHHYPGRVQLHCMSEIHLKLTTHTLPESQQLHLPSEHRGSLHVRICRCSEPTCKDDFRRWFMCTQNKEPLPNPVPQGMSSHRVPLDKSDHFYGPQSLHLRGLG